MTVLVSACLLGVACRYDGASKGLPDSVLRELMARHTLVPACPEQLGGLPTPRAPSERLGSRVVARTGADVTDAYTRGAQQTLALAQRFGCTAALLKQRSPSCGKGEIYDGTFTGTRRRRHRGAFVRARHPCLRGGRRCGAAESVIM